MIKRNNFEDKKILQETKEKFPRHYKYLSDVVKVEDSLKFV